MTGATEDDRGYGSIGSYRSEHRSDRLLLNRTSKVQRFDSHSDIGRPIVPFPASYEPVRHVRSTLLLSSLAVLRERGHERAYFGELPLAFHSAILEAVAGSWMPIEVGLAHYMACDALGMSTEAQVELGRAVCDRVKGTLLGTVMRMSKAAGVTPLTVLPQLQRFWYRAFDGGGLGAFSTGPKEVRFEMVKVPLADVRYFRNGMRGISMGLLDLFCTRSYVHEVPGMRASGVAVYRMQWA